MIDRRELPSYTVSEAAHYLSVPAATVRYWSVGRDEYEPLITVPHSSPTLVSFLNLAELHALAAIRRQHKVKMPSIRRAIEYLSKHARTLMPAPDWLRRSLPSGTSWVNRSAIWPTTTNARTRKSKKQSGANLRRLPEDLTLFLDRNLGKNIIANRLRSEGIKVEVHDDHLPSDAPDEEWIELVGQRCWVAVTRDRNVRYRGAELAAI